VTTVSFTYLHTVHLLLDLLASINAGRVLFPLERFELDATRQDLTL